MTQYINVKVKISEGQKEKLQHALKANCPTISIGLNHKLKRWQKLMKMVKVLRLG